MNIRCPNCGAVHSLDALIGNEAASAVLRSVLDLDADIGRAAVRYIGLFRPAKSQLSWARTAKLLNELLPDIKARRIARDGTEYPAPPEAWLYGFQATLEARDTGRLKLPLKSHGYLYEIISQYRAEGLPSPRPSPTGAGAVAAPSKLRQGVAALSEWAGADWLRQEIAAGFAVLSAMNLKGRPAAQDLPAVAELWARRMSERDETPVEQFDRVRIQTAFKVLGNSEEFPKPADLIRCLPPRLIPRAMLEKPAPDRAKGRAEMEKLKRKMKR